MVNPTQPRPSIQTHDPRPNRLSDEPAPADRKPAIDGTKPGRVRNSRVAAETPKGTQANTDRFSIKKPTAKRSIQAKPIIQGGFESRSVGVRTGGKLIHTQPKAANSATVLKKQAAEGSYSDFGNNLGGLLASYGWKKESGKFTILGETHEKDAMLSALASKHVMDALKDNNVHTLALEIRADFQDEVNRLSKDSKYSINDFAEDVCEKYKPVLAGMGFSKDALEKKLTLIRQRYKLNGKLIKAASERGVAVVCVEKQADGLKGHVELLLEDGRLEANWTKKNGVFRALLMKDRKYNDLWKDYIRARHDLYRTLSDSPNDSEKVRNAREIHKRVVAKCRQARDGLIANSSDVKKAFEESEQAKAALSHHNTVRLSDVKLSERIRAAAKRNGGNTVVVYGELHGSGSNDLDELLNANQIRITTTEQRAREIREGTILANEYFAALGEEDQIRDPPNSYLPLHGHTVQYIPR